MVKNLGELLTGIEIDENLISVISNLKIDKVSVNKKHRQWDIYISSSIVIDINHIKEIENIIKSSFNIADRVNIIIKPSVIHSNINLDIIDKDYGNDILSYVSEKIPFAGGWIKNSTRLVDGNNYIFTVENKFGAQFLITKECAKLIQGYVKDKFNIRIDVIISYIEGDEVFNQYHNDKDILDNKIISELITNKSSKTLPGSKTQSYNKSSIIMGKKTDNEIISIKEIIETSGKITIEGDIFNFKVIITKNGRTIISFNLTDYNGSITVKVFPNDKNSDSIKERLKDGLFCRVKGEASFDKFSKEVAIIASDIEECIPVMRIDKSEQKRVELHLHTQMSSMDGINSPSDLIATAAKWGHKAIAITDHGVVQAFPEAAEAAKKYGIRVIYGVEAYLVDNGIPVVLNANDMSIDGEYVALDIETTGLSYINDKITEIGAVRIINGIVVEKFCELIDPEISIPANITALTGINNEMVKGKPKIKDIIPNLIKFMVESALVAHNAKFDMSFIKKIAGESGYSIKNPVIDTLTLSRLLFPNLKKYKLDIVAKYLNISLENHHRAVDDALCAGKILMSCIKLIKEKGANTISDINQIFTGKQDFKKMDTYHTVILVKNYEGLLNLYKLISISHLDYYYRKPRILKSILEQYREGLIVGSGCEAGRLFKEILKGSSNYELADIVKFYDYLEIQPLANNEFLIKNNTLESFNQLEQINKKIIELGKKYNKLVVATGDVHFLNPRDEVFRRILMSGQGFDDADNQAPLYLKTTDEMLNDFSYLGQDEAYNVVIKNPNLVADMIENIKPIPDETFTPKIDGAEEEIRKMTMDKTHEIYGENLPEIVNKRLDKELNSIINNGYAVLYLIAQKLVYKSVSDGYLVGSRGSVGSSFVATMCGITEVNPLPPHYICQNCKNSIFITDGSCGSGADLPDKVCPECDIDMLKEGHDIPFEVFLGFEGDKEPDIDLNFSGEYQAVAHRYTEELFGKGHVFRAGTIGTLADKTAYGFVKNYIAKKNIYVNQAEVDRLTKGCTGIKKTTGQHPGGVMVVPRDNEIYQFTPIQHPADDSDSQIITTHFDYHSISGRLLKLDILGHDDPTIIKMLQDLTGINPVTLPLSDPKIMKLFTSTESLGITKEDINCEVGTLGLPEFGTKFVRQMLLDTQPKTFAELVRISGLSHGTDVWINNAQELIRQGTATLKDVISTRDDIMLYLMQKGVKPKNAFNIMERVRKGKGLRDEDMSEMKEYNVPGWYIDSCNKIKYMFPKGHAVAYVMMAVRIAYFKVYHPLAYYAAYFTVRADEFDSDLIVNGEKILKDKIKIIEDIGNEISQKEKSLLTILEIAFEMYKRGFEFHHVDIYKSDSIKFIITEGALLPPLNSLQGLGANAAKSVVTARENGKFISVEDLRNRTKISKTVIEILKNHGCLDGMDESNQLTLF